MLRDKTASRSETGVRAGLTHGWLSLRLIPGQRIEPVSVGNGTALLSTPQLSQVEKLFFGSIDYLDCYRITTNAEDMSRTRDGVFSSSATTPPIPECRESRRCAQWKPKRIVWRMTSRAGLSNSAASSTTSHCLRTVHLPEGLVNCGYGSRNVRITRPGRSSFPMRASATGRRRTDSSARTTIAPGC